jgi:fimbrial chaperone protein
MDIKRTTAMIAGLAAILLSSPALAGSLGITPLRISLTAATRTAGFTLLSEEPTPVLVQVHLLAWNQINGVDQLTPSSDLLVGPPILTIQPGQTQLIRVGLKSTPQTGRELTYRLLIEEVPVSHPGAGIQFALHLSMPIFVTSKEESVPNLHWLATKVDARHLRISLSNLGDRHVQIKSLRIVSVAKADVISSERLASYVLAGQSHSWLVSLNKPLEADPTLSALTDAGTFETRIDIRAP